MNRRVARTKAALLLAITGGCKQVEHRRPPAALAGAGTAPSAIAPAAVAPVPSFERDIAGVIVPVSGGFLRLRACADDIVRVSFATNRAFDAGPASAVVPDVASRGAPVTWDAAAGPGLVTLTTAKLRARVDAGTGAVSFADADGRPILAERAGGRSVEPADVYGDATHHVRQQWEPSADESLHGLGQQQLGLVDIKGYDLELWQHNTNVVVLMLVSSRGYGILWDNPSYSRFGDLRRPEPLPTDRLLDADGKSGGLTASLFADARFGRRVAQRTEAPADFTAPPEPAPAAATTAAANSATGLGPPAATGATTDPAMTPTMLPATATTVAGLPGATGPATRTARRPRARPNGRLHPDLPDGDVSVRWEGQLDPPATGDYLFSAYSNGGIRCWIDGTLVMDHWRQSWLPSDDVAKVRLDAGRRVPIKIEWTKDGGANVFRFRWKTPAPPDAPTSLWSESGDGTDYYFVYGPSLDRVVAGYRHLTGQAAMPPRWAFGLWQSRQRYETQQQSLDAVDGFRARRIPFDNIVQDWMYWPKESWGSHAFDPARFPDPAGWIKSIHDRHANLMISVWGKFYPGTKNFDAMNARGFLYPANLREGTRDWLSFPFTFYDAFNPEARQLFWEQMNESLFAKGVDAWWMDATEPDMQAVPSLEGAHVRMSPTAAGPASRVLNAYALENARGIHEGQRRAAPDRRVFNLTRSGYAGQQRYSAATWSGDITSTWTAVRKQIPAGLGFSVSGVPYWTMDSGGFSVPQRFARRNASPADADEWRELNARWFQFATFCPLLRVHGEFPLREMWEFGGDISPAYQAQLKFDRLRYRMLPYVYSLAGAVTQDGGTLLRPLVMDFPGDAKARALTDQYLFGPALLVSPVTEYQARTRRVYLPEAPGGWYDFWTGAAVAGGRTVDAPAPYDAIPVHVRAGSIIPFGPELQYTGEKPPDPITLYVYAGAGGAFSLYEDDGTTNAYERGEFTRIPIRWDEAKRTLTIGARAGTFPGALAVRMFHVVFVSKTDPAGFSVEAPVAKGTVYRGEAITVRAP